MTSIQGTQYNAARAQWGSDWRIPAEDEIEELMTECVQCQRRTGLAIRPVAYPENLIEIDIDFANSSKFDTDGILQINQDASAGNDAVYTLQGVKVEGTLKPGIAYVHLDF